MKIRILEIIYNQYMSGKPIDSSFIEKMLETVVSYNELNDYITCLYINDEFLSSVNNKYHLADYRIVERDMVVHLMAINAYAEQVGNVYSKRMSQEDIKFLKVLVASHAILHEVEHAKQNKQYCLNKNDMETDLISMVLEEKYKFADMNKTFNYYLQQGMGYNDIYKLLEHKKELYTKYYKYNPTERMADIRSHETLTDTLELVKDSIPYMYNYEYACYSRDLISGYINTDDSIQSPVEFYIHNMLNEDINQEYSTYYKILNGMGSGDYKNELLINKLTLGLPILESERPMVKKIEKLLK